MNNEKKLLDYFLLMVALFVVQACDKNIKHALDVAGENRAELEKVLEHFKDDPDPLKYEAAKFLIENMPSQCYMDGASVDMMDSIFISASCESQNVRTKYFNDSASKIHASQADMSYDISEMKADYLIKAINEACDMWERSTWKDDYDRSLFFEYVLPYRLCQEKPSDWRASVTDAFPMFDKDIVMSRRGIQLEAEDAQTSECDIKEYGGASNGKANMMYPGKSSLTYRLRNA